jgi:hypothetical protein
MSHLKVNVLLALSLSWLNAAGDSAVAAQQRRATDKVIVRAKGRTGVVVKERGRAHTLNISKHIGAARINDVSVLFMTREGASVYLVLQVCGLSKLPPDDRHCGAGVECNIIWLKLDNSWRERKAQSELYESCWLPITSDDGPTIVDGRLLLQYDDLREEMHYKVDYDADHPGKGFVVEKKPIPKDSN